MWNRSLGETKPQRYFSYLAGLLAGLSLLSAEVVSGFQILGAALIVGSLGCALSEFSRSDSNK